MQIGERLKEARELKGITLEDIQTETKIQKRYLVAIEQEDFHALPGKFYARAFIKEYAQAVDINPNELLQGFDESKIKTKEDTVQYTRMERSRRPKSESKGTSFLSFLPTVIVVILIIGIISVAWLLVKEANKSNGDEPNNQGNEDEIIRNTDNGQYDEEDSTTDTDDGEGEETDKDEGEEDEDEPLQEDEFSMVEKGEGNSPKSELDFIYSGDTVQVRFEITDEAYVEFSNQDSENYLVGVLNEDDKVEEYDVTEDESLYFNIGFAPGVTIYLNDVELEYPVDTSTVHQRITVNLKQSE